MPGSKELVLGVEGGGTKTEWIFISHENGESTLLRHGRLPASNFKFITEESLVRLLRTLPTEATRVGVFLAGCGTDHDRKQLRQIVESVWPHAEIAVGSDRNSGLATAFPEGDGIAVIAGTGSAVHGKRGDLVERAGGWGQLLGDRGSGYDLAMQGLRYCLRMYDLEHRTTLLARALLRELGLNRLDDLVNWVKDADKLSVAKLAPVIFEAARRGERELQTVIENGARRLAEYTWAVAGRLGLDAPEVRLMGGLFVNHPEYADLFKTHVSGWLPHAHVEMCAESGAIGAARLALDTAFLPAGAPPAEMPPPAEAAELADAATEQVNPRSTHLDELETPQLIELFVAEEEHVTHALAGSRADLVEAVDLVTEALQKGGRLFYVGAGTSGRLGVLDASEIPPTFSAPPDLVQGIIAGGFPALQRSVEGAEDSEGEGALAVDDRGVQSGDVVCGIAASGRTPFVLGALRRARESDARTILLTCNPNRRHDGFRWDVEIDLATGPELITGSTRLKAGTATKLALNILSTCAMIRLGKVVGNFMVDLNPSNVKLRDRATRIVSQILGCSYEDAERQLEEHGWHVRACLEAMRAGGRGAVGSRSTR